MNHEALRAGREVGAAESDEDDFSYGGSIKAFRRQQKSAKRSGSTAGGQTQWIDGTQPGSPDDDDDGPQPRQRKLSKSERKRLRKLKARDRAA